MGDLNDEIDEPRERNVFQNFIDADSLFDEWEASGPVETIRLDDVMDDYLTKVSDHRPVALRLKLGKPGAAQKL